MNIYSILLILFIFLIMKQTRSKNGVK